jgi:hypothetical protein
MKSAVSHFDKSVRSHSESSSSEFSDEDNPFNDILISKRKANQASLATKENFVKNLDKV